MGNVGSVSASIAIRVFYQERPMASTEMRKQISIFLPLSDWRLIRDEAARLGVPITELCRRWMRADLTDLRTRGAEHNDHS